MAKPAAAIRAQVQARWPGAVVDGRGRNWLRHRHPDQPNRFTLDASIGPLHVAGAETEIDSDWQATTGAWQYQMQGADFHAFSRNQLGVGTMYRYQDPATGEYVEFQPLALNWVNDQDSRQQITQPQSVMAQVVGGDTLRFPNGYGPGRHFEYQAQTARLQKRLIIDSLAALPAPTVTGTPHLEIEFILNKSAGVTEWVDGVQWDRSTRTGTAGRIEYRNAQGNVLFAVDHPRAWDSAAGQIMGLTVLRRQGGNRLVTVRIPRAWLLTATFPVTLDPTIDATVGEFSATGDDDGRWFIDVNTHFAPGDSNIGIGFVNASFPDGNLWARFTGISGLGGATIDVAYLTLQNVFGLSATFSTIVSAVDEAAPAAPSSAADAEGRARTTATVPWEMGDMSGGVDYDSPSLVTVLQELADSHDPSEIMLYVEDNDSGTTGNDGRTFISYETSTVNCPRLHVEYTAGGGAGFTGTAAGTLFLVASAATGELRFEGSQAGTAPLATAAASGTQTFGGTGAAALPLPTSAAEGAQNFEGSAAGTLPLATADAEGTSLLAITGTGDGTLPLLQGSGGVSPAPTPTTGGGRPFTVRARVPTPAIRGVATARLHALEGAGRGRVQPVVRGVLTARLHALRGQGIGRVGDPPWMEEEDLWLLGLVDRELVST